ncbi:OmpA family protein [Myxococcota bacterium]
MRLIPATVLVACAQTQTTSGGPQATRRAEDEPVAPTQRAEAEDAPTAKDETSDTGGDDRVFKIRESTTARLAHGVNPSKIEPTKTEAALRLFVVDKDKGPIDGIVISLIAPDGTKYFTEETDAKGYAEVLVPVGQTYDVVYLSLGRRDISAKVTVENSPNFNLKLTLRYARRVTRTVNMEGKARPRFVLDGVQFETGKAILTPDSFARLDTIVEYMTHKKSARIEISGHTDNVGKSRRNNKLSERRAEACRDYLVSKGIKGSRIETVGYGDTRPIASNDTEEGRQQNRRIEAIEQ